MRRAAVPLAILMLAGSIAGYTATLPHSGTPASLCGAQVITGFLENFNRADPQALAALFAEDGDLLIPSGGLYRGRGAIGEFYRQIFASGYRGSRSTAHIAAARRIGRSVCLLDGTWQLSPPPARKSESPEAGLFCALLIRRDHGWRIAALREQTGAQVLKLQ